MDSSNIEILEVAKNDEVMQPLDLKVVKTAPGGMNLPEGNLGGSDMLPQASTSAIANIDAEEIEKTVVNYSSSITRGEPSYSLEGGPSVLNLQLAYKDDSVLFLASPKELFGHSSVTIDLSGLEPVSPLTKWDKLKKLVKLGSRQEDKNPITSSEVLDVDQDNDGEIRGAEGNPSDLVTIEESGLDKTRRAPSMGWIQALICCKGNKKEEEIPEDWTPTDETRV